MAAKPRHKKSISAYFRPPPPPPEPSALVLAFRSGHYDGASTYIQRNLLANTTEQSRNDQSVRAEFKDFGRAFAQAKRAGSPVPLFGKHYQFANTTKAHELWPDRLFRCFSCEKLRDAQHPNVVILEDTEMACERCAPNYVYSSLMGCHILRGNTVVVHTGPNETSEATPQFAHRSRGNAILFREAYYTPAYYEQIHESLRGAHVAYLNGDNPFNPKFLALTEYHSSKKWVERLPSPLFDRAKPPLLVGIELEIELSQTDHWTKQKMDSASWRMKAAQELKALLNGPNGEEHYAIVETDGSISYGFEIVTGWTGLDTHERILRVMKTPAFEALVKKYGMKSHDTTTCGLHVTVDRAGMSMLHLGKFQVFLNAPANASFLDKICRRSASRYAKKKHDKYNTVMSVTPERMSMHEADRYEIANTSGNKHAIEFRGPKGTLRFESIMASMEFIRLVWMFTREASIQQLNYASFTDFVWRREHAHESQYLRPYMVEKEVAAPDYVEIPTTRRLSVQESLVDASAMGFIVKSKDQ